MIAAVAYLLIANNAPITVVPFASMELCEAARVKLIEQGWEPKILACVLSQERS